MPSSATVYPTGPVFRDYDFKSLVVMSDADHFKPPVVYEFSGERTFTSTDDTDSVVYE